MNRDNPFSILLVEDDKNALEIISSLLTLKFPQAQLYVAENGKIGLDLFGLHLPDIIITDINMPEMDGLQMLDVIRAVKPDTCVIVATAHSQTCDLKKIGATCAIVELVPKPIHFEHLFAAILRCCESVQKLHPAERRL
jgi:CheY-like chemotaxis protein